MASRDWPRSTRPVVMGTRHMISAGHYLAAASTTHSPVSRPDGAECNASAPQFARSCSLDLQWKSNGFWIAERAHRRLMRRSPRRC